MNNRVVLNDIQKCKIVPHIANGLWYTIFSKYHFYKKCMRYAMMASHNTYVRYIWMSNNITHSFIARYIHVMTFVMIIIIIIIMIE